MKSPNKATSRVKASQKNRAVQKIIAINVEEQIDLADMVPKIGQLTDKKRNKVLKAWQKAQDNFYEKEGYDKVFNPTSMDGKTFLNFLDYLQINNIDRELGLIRDFVPTQDYEQEVIREFRKR